jgi:hypothetical protein
MKQKLHDKILKIQPGLLIVFGLFAAVSLASSATALAWGPDRPTFTKQSPATYVTFNSITDSDFGDERNFVLAKAVSEGANQWRDKIDVTKNDEFYIKVFVHNNAAANLNLVSTGTKVLSNIPQNGFVTRVQIDAIVQSQNANPKEVWDQVVFDSNSKFQIAYIAGSARYYNNANVGAGGTALPDSVVDKNTGALIGYNAMDGNIPGCYQYSGYVLYKVKTTVEDTPGTPPPATPETPTELPKTGPVEAALAILAVLAITIGAVYWYKSRVDMRKIALGDDHKKPAEELTAALTPDAHGAHEAEDSSEEANK